MKMNDYDPTAMYLENPDWLNNEGGVIMFHGKDESSTRVDYYYDELSKARKRISVLEHRTKTLLYLAKRDRAYFRVVSEEWEDKRDRYQEAVKERGYDLAALRVTLANETKRYQEALDGRTEARAGHSKEIRRVVELEEFYYQACKQRDEAVERLLYFKGLYEQGAPMTIAGMNTRIAELEKKADTLTGRLNLSKLAIAARNTRISRLREVLSVVTYKPDLGCGSCVGNLVIAKRALEEDDEQTKT